MEDAVLNATWVSGTPVVYSIDGLAVGSYNFTIFATDGYGQLVQDSVIVMSDFFDNNHNDHHHVNDDEF